MKLLFATHNAGKVKELRALVGDALEVLSAADLSLPEVVEDGQTFAENARKKAVACAEATGLLSLADDSGLTVDALDGAPGVHSARYAQGDDRARYEKLLTALADVPDLGRGAAFRCVLCLALPDGRTFFAEGECKGTIARSPKGEGGFGYDPVFELEPGGRTMAELTREEKSAVSHRGAAFRKLAPTLEKLARGAL